MAYKVYNPSPRRMKIEEVRAELAERGMPLAELRRDFKSIGLNCTFDEWTVDLLEACYQVDEDEKKEPESMSRFYCKPCLEKGHQCYAIDGVEFESADDAVCRFCDDGVECPVAKHEREKAATIPAPIGKSKALAVTKKAPMELSPVELGEHNENMRDLIKVLSQTMMGVLDNKITPQQANAVCGTANTILKVADMARKLAKA